MNPKSEIDAFCKGCYHLDEYLPACAYILHTSEKRPCPAGKGCKVRITPEGWRKFVEGQREQEERARRREQARRGGSNKANDEKKRMTWTPGMCDLLRHLVADGMTGSQIAKIIGTTPSAVYQKIRVIGIERPEPASGKKRGRPGRVWTAEKTAELLRLRAQGLTHKEIGERLGMTTKAIETRLFVLRSREKYRQPKEADV